MICRWPEPQAAHLDDEAEGDMGLLMDLIRQVRNARAEYSVTPGRRVPAVVVGGSKTEMLQSQRDLLTFLAKVDDAQLTLVRTVDETPRKAVALVASEGVEAYLPLAGLLDLDQEVARLEKELAGVDREIRRSEGKLANQGFVSKAPRNVVEREQERLAELQERRARLEARRQLLLD